MKASYPKLHTIQSDVADPAQIASLASRVKADYPKLEVLMNNAGIMIHKSLAVRAADLDGLTTEVDINLGGVISTTSAFIDILTANKGTLINVSSGLALLPRMLALARPSPNIIQSSPFQGSSDLRRSRPHTSSSSRDFNLSA